MSVVHLSDRSVMLALQEITEELGAPAAGITDAQDAEELIAALFHAAGHPAPQLPHEEAEAAAAGRRLLTLFTEDATTAALTRSVLVNPPEDDQLSSEAAAGAVVLLAAVLSWMQTKISFRFRRDHEGRREIEFRLEKEAAPPQLLRQIAQILRDRFLPPGS